MSAAVFADSKIFLVTILYSRCSSCCGNKERIRHTCQLTASWAREWNCQVVAELITTYIEDMQRQRAGGH